MNVYKGTTTPSVDLGIDGDLYFNTLAGLIYHKVELNTWQLVGSFNFSADSVFAAADDTKWTGAASPASLQDALDQLASRVQALEDA